MRYVAIVILILCLINACGIIVFKGCALSPSYDLAIATATWHHGTWNFATQHAENNQKIASYHQRNTIHLATWHVLKE